MINDNYKEDITNFIEFLISNNIPNDEIIKFKNDLKNININESFNKLKYKYNKWLNDRLFKWLINRKKSFYIDLMDKLEIFNLDTLDDVYKNFPGFKLNSMYLAGGMDDAVDTGRGWRNRLEYEFEVKNPGKIKSKLKPIELYGKEINPSYVVDDIYLDLFLKNSNKILKIYNKPALLNPVRKEIDRVKDNTFDLMVKDLKDPDYDPDKNILPFKWFGKTFSKNIEPDDEHLLRISDAVFLGQDRTAGAGTYGELQLLSLIRKPLFAWLVNESTGRVGSFKLWNIPHLCKVARTESDMVNLVKTIVRYSQS